MTTTRPFAPAQDSTSESESRPSFAFPTQQPTTTNDEKPSTTSATSAITNDHIPHSTTSLPSHTLNNPPRNNAPELQAVMRQAGVAVLCVSGSFAGRCSGIEKTAMGTNCTNAQYCHIPWPDVGTWKGNEGETGRGIMPSEQFQGLLQVLEAGRAAQTADRTLEEWREMVDQFLGIVPAVEGVDTQPATVGGVPCEWSRVSGTTPTRTIFYLHGGGYCIGSVAGYRSPMSHLAATAEAAVLSVDYRLAPEHPYPSALDDAVAAYKGLLDGGTDPATIVIGGDSAGGGLTVVTLLTLRDAGIPLPAAAVCISPWTDLGMSGTSMTQKAEADPLLTFADLAMFAGHYLSGTEATATTPMVTPIAGDLTGLPPLLVFVGTAEILLSDATRLAEAAGQANVRTTLEIADGMMHIWPLFAPLFPEASDALKQIGTFVKEQTGNIS